MLFPLGNTIKFTTFNLPPLSLFTSEMVELFSSSRMKGVKKNLDNARSDVDVERLKLVGSLKYLESKLNMHVFRLNQFY